MKLRADGISLPHPVVLTLRRSRVVEDFDSANTTNISRKDFWNICCPDESAAFFQAVIAPLTQTFKMAYGTQGGRVFVAIKGGTKSRRQKPCHCPTKAVNLYHSLRAVWGIHQCDSRPSTEECSIFSMGVECAIGIRDGSRYLRVFENRPTRCPRCCYR